MEEIARWQKHVASSGGETGAVTFVQRFDATLGCFVHFHVLVPDGVFTRADAAGAVVFREGPAPTRVDIANVAARVEKRRRRWLRRRGLLDEQREEDRSNEAPSQSPLEASMQLSLFGSTSLRVSGDGAAVPIAVEEARFRAAGKGPWVAEASGFNVHAGIKAYRGNDNVETLGEVEGHLEQGRDGNMIVERPFPELASMIAARIAVPSGPVAKAGATPTKPRARKKKRTTKTTPTNPDDASPLVATAEGTSPERGRSWRVPPRRAARARASATAW